MSSEDVKDAIRLANHTVFGLGAAVFTRDLARAVDGGKPAQQITRLDHYYSSDALQLPDGGWLYSRGTGAWWRDRGGACKARVRRAFRA